MSTVIRNEVSKSNPYYLPKHRYLELKHFCLQYPDWRKEYGAIIFEKDDDFDPTGKKAVRLKMLTDRMAMVEETAKEVDPVLAEYLFFAVTGDKSYTYLRTAMNIPCGKNLYYDLYRKFWWLLSKKRE